MDDANEVSRSAQDLVIFFKSQAKAAEALGVEQPTISNWLRGKNGVSPVSALRAEQVTGGKVKAVDLCPKLAEVFEASGPQRVAEVQ
ncbi:transcriptional regulator [Microbulbifer variabilis]|uniref:transcriptional regulator n=1 Tax=Microbulbifer variabilis TaxID=266805 RepID=UPI0003642DA5|nr:YdaS family helix-turn-helix protein [Microbulbifer variabilis]